MKVCFLLFHLSTGDNLLVYGMVRHLLKTYDIVNIFCLQRNVETITQLYSPWNNVKIHIVPDHNNCDVPDADLQKALSTAQGEYDVLRTGCHTGKGLNGPFWRSFYFDLGLPYEIRYQYKDIFRNKNREEDLYNKVVKLYGDKYVFTHDHRNIKYQHYDPRANVNIASGLPIFHPNINYRGDTLWTADLISNNLFDYGLLLEKATEIHVTDSSFALLCAFIDVSQVTKKVLYTKHDYIDMDKTFANGWIITGYQQ